MRWFSFLILLLVVTLLDCGQLLNFLAFGKHNIRPDLLLIMMIFFAVKTETRHAVITSFIIGFAADISASAMGPYMLTFGIIGSILSQMRTVFVMKRMIYQAVVIFIIGLITLTIAELLILIKTHNPSTFTAVFATAVYSALIGPFIWPVYEIFASFIAPRKNSYRTRTR